MDTTRLDEHKGDNRAKREGKGTTVHMGIEGSHLSNANAANISNKK